MKTEYKAGRECKEQKRMMRGKWGRTEGDTPGKGEEKWKVNQKTGNQKTWNQIIWNLSERFAFHNGLNWHFLEDLSKIADHSNHFGQEAAGNKTKI